jgi:arylsulfatase A-like enzyme
MPDETKEQDRHEAPLNDTKDRALSRRNILLGSSALVAAATMTSGALAQAQKAAPVPAPVAPGAGNKPNIVIIWGDDIGQSDISAYSRGLMGFKTPNIDRIANEGMMFTDYYAEQSCTAGRASFITGQSGLRTGMTKVGLPGATLGLQKEDPTIAELLKPLGYATGQFGKNHLGDRNEYLPTVHGFDEFYGNLYHLNAEEEPELPDYPKSPEFRAKYGPRGVLDCKASEKDDTTVDPRFGKVGKQTCTDTGPLTKARMVAIDDDIADRATDFMKRQTNAGKPFFLWVTFTHMHFRTHPKPESIGQAGRWQSPYHDTMIDHDKNVGSVLKVLDDLGIADNTFVMYGTDNGPHMNSWPDGAMTPFRNEKNSNWEGAYRVPAMVREKSNRGKCPTTLSAISICCLRFWRSPAIRRSPTNCLRGIRSAI